MKALLGFPKGSDELELLLGFPRIRNTKEVPETLPTGLSAGPPDVWFDAEDDSTITIATGVSAWLNKGSAGSSASQGTGGNQPLRGKYWNNDRRVLLFDGAGDRLDIGVSNIDRTCTWFQVGQINTGETAIVFCGTQGNNGDEHQFSPGGTLTIFDRFAGAAEISASVPGPGDKPFVLAYTLDTGVGTGYMRMNQYATTMATTGSASAAGNIAIMFDHISGTITRAGKVAEMIRFPSPLTTAEVDLVMQYLGQKWDVEVNQ